MHCELERETSESEALLTVQLCTCKWPRVEKQELRAPRFRAFRLQRFPVQNRRALRGKLAGAQAIGEKRKDKHARTSARKQTNKVILLLLGNKLSLSNNGITLRSDLLSHVCPGLY